MKRYLSFASALALASLLHSTATAQTTYDWSGATNGAWLSPANWANGIGGTYPGVSAATGSGNANDVARFTNATTTVGINMATAGGQLSLGAIDFNSLTSLTIGNSASDNAGILQLNGATVNAVANTLISVGSAGGNLTFTNSAGGNASTTMGLRLGIPNGVFNVYGDANPGGIRTLTINTIVSEANAGSGFTVQGGGSVLLSQANTFTGDVIVNNGRVQISNTDALGTGAGKTIINSGGTLFLNTALPVNENIDFAGNGFTELATLFGSIRIGNVATTMNGTLTMTDNAMMFVQGNTTTLNGGLGETGGARNLSLAGGGTLAIASAGSYTGTTTITQSTINVTGDNGVLSGTTGISVNGAGTFRLSNTVGTGNVGNRLNDAASVTLNNGTFNFAHTAVAATSYAETAGNLNISFFANTVSSSQAVAGQTSVLTFNALSRTANTGGVNFAGTGLGAADGQNQILFTTAPALVGGATQATGGIIGGWATYNTTTTGTGTDAFFASYGVNGVMQMGNINTSQDASTWTATNNVKLTMNGTQVTGIFVSPSGASPSQINSLTALISNDNNADGNANVIAVGGILRINSGGILTMSPANPAAPALPGPYTMNAAPSTILTSGTNELIFNIGANGTWLQGGALINGPLGATGITKLGGGTLAIRTDQLDMTGPLVIMGNGAGSAVRIDNNDGLGGLSSVTLKAGVGGDGSVLNLNTTLLAPVNKPLFMEAFMTGGLSTAVSAAGVTGLNSRSALITNSNNTWSGPITVTGNHYVQFYQNTAGNTLTLSGAINAGPEGFTGLLLARGNNPGGIVNITGAINLPQGTVAATTGAIVLLPAVASNVYGLNSQSGSIRLGGNNVFPATTILALGQNASGNLGQFWMNGFSQTFASVNIQTGSTGAAASQIIQNGANANSTLTFAGNANPSTFAGTIRDDDPAAATTGILGLTQTAGNLTLSGANTYTGVTALNGGALSIPSISNATVAGPLGSAAVAATNLVINGGTLNYTGASGSTDRGFTAGASGATFNVTTAASNLAFGGNSVMTGALNKVGPGTLSLGGASTGAGATNVNAGTLLVNNTTGVGTGTGLTTVASGATIGGNGTVGGSLTIQTGATLSPGNSVGTLNAGAGTTEWAGAGRYLVEYDHTGGTFTPGTTIDLYNSAGSLNLSATTGTPFVIDLRFLGDPAAVLPTPTSVRIATFTGGGFGTYTDPAQFTFAGDFVGASPTVTVNGNDLVLNFTPVPEPATMGFFAAAIAGFAVRRMRKRAA
jgi:fibronectin-binding autotransporter adhesin